MLRTNKHIADELDQFSKRWDKAIEENNVFEIGKFMADDWVIVGTEGGITSKSDFLKFVESGDLIHDTMAFDSVRIEVYREAGIVTSKGTSSGKFKGEPFSYYEWSTSIFINANGHWLCVHTMLTPAEQTSFQNNETV